MLLSHSFQSFQRLSLFCVVWLAGRWDSLQLISKNASSVQMLTLGHSRASFTNLNSLCLAALSDISFTARSISHLTVHSQSKLKLTTATKLSQHSNSRNVLHLQHNSAELKVTYKVSTKQSCSPRKLTNKNCNTKILHKRKNLKCCPQLCVPDRTEANFGTNVDLILN